MRDRDLKRLSKVTTLRLTQAQSALKQIADEETRLRVQLKDLDQPVQKDSTAPLGMIDFKIEAQWRQWAEQRKESVQMALATVLAKRAEAQQMLRHALSKDQAVCKLIKKSEETARAQKAFPPG